MTIQEALEIVVELARQNALGPERENCGVLGSEGHGQLLAIDIVEIMLAEETFFTAIQEMTVEREIDLLARER